MFTQNHINCLKANHIKISTLFVWTIFNKPRRMFYNFGFYRYAYICDSSM